MPNEKGLFSWKEVMITELPYYIPALKQWSDEPYKFAEFMKYKNRLPGTIGIKSDAR